MKDTRWIILKGMLFAFLAVYSGALQVMEDFAVWKEALLLAICVWSACRFYYFLFHVLHAYVDPELKSAGVMDLLGKLCSKNRDKLVVLRDKLVALVGDPPYPRLRTAQLILAGACVAGAITALWFRLLGYWWIVDELVLLKISPVWRELARIMAPPLPGPLLLASIGALAWYCAKRRKRFPAWAAVIGFLGGLGTVLIPGLLAHSFRFASCGGRSDLMEGVGLLGMISLPACYLLNIREHECRPEWLRILWRKKRWFVLSAMLLLGWWIVVDFFVWV